MFFEGSANVDGRNPSNNCQLFSVPVTGGAPYQITSFQEVERSRNGCVFSSIVDCNGDCGGCYVSPPLEDPATGSLVFYSSCRLPEDEQKGPSNGGQLFAIRPDGSGLRQLTDTEGFVTNGDGTFSIELPGPFEYSTTRRTIGAPAF